MTTSTAHLQASDGRGRAARLIDFLRDITQLRSSRRVSLDELGADEKVIWLKDIPEQTDGMPSHVVFSRLSDPVRGTDEDLWISIRKYQEPTLPPAPDSCQSWVPPDLNAHDDKPPSLMETAVPNDAAGADSRQLRPSTGVQDAWREYIGRYWDQWSLRHRIWRAVQAIYEELYRIHTAQQRLGENYELVLGVGLLQWAEPSTEDKIKRHLLGIRAQLTFDAPRGRFEVRLDPEGGGLRLELDMLSPTVLPGKERVAAHRQHLDEEGDDPWARELTTTLLTTFANELASGGKYLAEVNAPLVRTTDQPSVCFAPALILRRRRAIRFLEVLDAIADSLAKGEQPPASFRSVCEWEIENHPSGNGERSGTKETFFPLPVNDEQREILTRLELSSAVLVQGPPGTGKSHTIANLICHLLATGQRVLVTAQTPRALRVLDDKLPKSIRPLCVSLLEDGISGRHRLNLAVSFLQSQFQNWRPSTSTDDILRLEKRLDDLRRKKAETDSDICRIREKETAEWNLAEGRYKGTAATIAKKVVHDASRYDWFTDTVPSEAPLPLPLEEWTALLESMRWLTPERRAALHLMKPPKDRLPDSEEFERLIASETEVDRRIADLHAKNHDSGVFDMIRKLRPNDLQSVRRSLNALDQLMEKAQRRPCAWVSQALKEVITGKDRIWREMQSRTAEGLNGLEQAARAVDALNITGTEGHHHTQSLLAALELRKHFEMGGGVGFLCFRPAAVRRNKWLLDKVLVNGARCDNVETLKMLMSRLDAEESLDRIWRLWEGKAERVAGILPLQVAEIQEILEALDVVFEADVAVQTTENLFAEVGLSQTPVWHDLTSIRSWVNSCEAVSSDRRKLEIHRQLEAMSVPFAVLADNPHAHPLVREFVTALHERHSTRVRSLLEQIEELYRQDDRTAKTQRQVETILTLAPKLMAQITAEVMEPAWDSRLSEIGEAWAAATISAWVRSFGSIGDLQALDNQSKRIGADIQETVAELATQCAIRAAMTRMTEEQRRYLQGWQQAIKKLGKGTGKYAPYWRKQAGQSLEGCRETVPAWVMPLHKLYDSIVPRPGLFDVAIIDEASQCGLDALPLMFLAKRILIVGDDQQIAPEAVGLDRKQVQVLLDRHLPDFQHKSVFQVDFSLFDVGRLYLSQAVVLREHFRCVPEIIRFSNELSYADTPLIPLRQYPPKRLPPVMAVHVKDGYRKGKGASVTNEPEAGALARQVSLCCRDASYEGKSMGVICLQGREQSGVIESLLLEELGAEEMERRRIICGEPYSFQGDERDVIFLSLVAAPNESIGAFAKETDRRRMNVAVSRARDQVWLFHSVTPNDLSSADLRKFLLEYFLDPSVRQRIAGLDREKLEIAAREAMRDKDAAPKPFDSWFEVDVALAIASRRYHLRPQFEIAGRRIDLLVEGEKSRLAVECDGDFWHGREQFQRDMDRQRILERVGMHFHRIRASSFYADRASSMELLTEDLSRMGIEPWDPSADSSEPPPVGAER